MSLVDEIALATPSPFFHLGGDEPVDLGAGTSRQAVAAMCEGGRVADAMEAVASIDRVMGGVDR